MTVVARGCACGVPMLGGGPGPPRGPFESLITTADDMVPGGRMIGNVQIHEYSGETLEPIARESFVR